MPEQKQGVNWDLKSFFPEFNGPEMKKFRKALDDDVASIQEKAAAMPELNDESADDWEKILLKAEDIETRLWHIFSYVGCLTAAFSDNEEYSAEEASLGKLLAEYQKFDVDIQRAFKPVDADAFEKFISRESLKGAEHSLRTVKEKAAHTMSPDKEKLNADLSVDGFHSWGRLYDKISGKMEFEMKYPDGRVETKPISQWRSLMSDVDRDIGKAAFEGGNKAWEGLEDTCAAALNAIAGTRLTLNKYRGIDHFLYTALFQSQIKRETLDAMYKAIHDNIDIGREIFRVKARYMGRDSIDWYERESPLPLKDTATYTWDEGNAMVQRSFDTVFPKFAEYYKSFIEKGWIESEIRPGKRPGAFCTGSPLTREQRVYMTYNGTMGDTTTLAHEVGHAYHGHILKEMRTWAKEYPMTLAETASIFSELIFAEGMYSDDSISDGQKLMMLDADLSGAAVLLLDITVRFEFEKAFHEERANDEVSVSRLKELMVEKQREILGDCLTDGGEDEFFWASKLHFYITGVTFYNFPYTFGFLLARALFSLFKKEGAAFLPKYDELLRLTGSDTVENVAMRSLGVDITDPAFWAESITGLNESLELFKNLTTKSE